MPQIDTFVAAEGTDKLYLTSGQFSSTIKTSINVTSINPEPEGLSWDGTNVPWIGAFGSDRKLYLTSGVFSTTLKDSEDVSSIDLAPTDASWDGTDTPWTGENGDKLYLTSGQFTSTLKTSQDVSGIHPRPQGISYDSTNTPWSGIQSGSSVSKLFLTSGQFSSTIKDSEDTSAIDTAPTGITFDGTDTPWIGDEANKFYLTSGQFISTLKKSTFTLIGGVSGIETEQLTVAVCAVGTIITAPTDESDIVAGGKTLILQIITGRLDPQTDTWDATIGGNNAKTQALIDGITGSGVEPTGWNAVVRAGLAFGDVTRDSSTQVTILLPAFASFDIAATELVTVTVPTTALTLGSGPLIAEPSFTVEPQIPAGSIDTVWGDGDSPVKLFLQSGQFTSTVKDSEDVSAFDASLLGIFAHSPDAGWVDNDDKLYKISGQFSSTLKTSLDITAVDSDVNALSWDGTASNNTPVTGNFANKLFLTSGQFSTTIKTSEAVGAINATPKGISYDSVDTPWAGQLNTTTFNDKLYLQSGQFTSTIKTSANINFIDTIETGISFSNTTGHTPWIGSGDDKLYLSSGQISTTLKDSEDVSALSLAPQGIDVNDRFAVSGPVSITLSGSIIPATEADIRAGAKVIVLSLTGDTWEATVGADNAITQALIDGLTSAGSEPDGWNLNVRDFLTALAVTRISDTVVTVTLPAFTTYDISADEIITATVPASALTTTVVATVAAPTFTITFIPVAAAPRPKRRATYDEVEFYTYIGPDGTEYPLNTPHDVGRFVINFSGFGTPGISYVTQRSPFQDGVSVRDFFLEPRVIQFLVRENFRGRDAWWDGRADLLDAIRPNRQLTDTATVPGSIKICRPDGTFRQIDVFIGEGPRFEPRRQGIWDEWSFMEVLRFIAHDPIFYEPTRINTIFALTLDSDLVFPITFEPATTDIKFGGGDVDTTSVINYVGTWKSLPVLILTGPIELPRIDNVTTGEKIEFTTDIIGGQVVTIDLGFGAKTVRDQTGANLIGQLTADSDLQTWHIAPEPEAPLGVNSIRLQGKNANGNTGLEVRFFTRYFGI